MLAGAKQEGTSDVAYSRNQPSVLEDDREPQRQSGARSGAPQTSNPRRIADFRRSQVCDSRIHKLARTIDYVFGPSATRLWRTAESIISSRFQETPSSRRGLQVFVRHEQAGS